MRNFLLGNIFGSHMPMRLQMEEVILSGLNSRVGLNVMHAKDETIGVEDYMNGELSIPDCYVAFDSVLTLFQSTKIQRRDARAFPHNNGEKVWFVVVAATLIITPLLSFYFPKTTPLTSFHSRPSSLIYTNRW